MVCVCVCVCVWGGGGGGGGGKISCEIWKGTFEISHKIWTHAPQSMHFTDF